jgi:hypothetical protein
MSHRFKIQQRVRLARTAFSSQRTGSPDIYEIVRLMPADQTGEPAYRVKSGMTERAVRESEISAAFS